MPNSASAPAPANANAAPALPKPPKPIRFVTNHDGPYAKRRRIISACLTCRRKKTRCSGERPVCGTCAQNRHACAGYGQENDHSPPEPTNAKRRRRESSSSSNAPAHKPQQEGAHPPPLPLQPTTLPNAAVAYNTNTSNPGQPRPEHRRTDSQLDNAAGHALSLRSRTRMPYFRYFGTTAIMPGFKQMVVKVRGKQHGTGHTSSEHVDSSPAQPPSVESTPAQEFRTPGELPVYDTSTMSPSPLITHLCQLFLTHLGCTFPFLQRERFLRDLEEKQVDAILVDAVCALAARFSTHPLITGSAENPKDGESEGSKIQPSEYGQAFSQRAKSAILEAFPCPSVAVVQAALLLAYDEFGAGRDSGLWMYLGIAIRMAQDLGMQTPEGLRYEGRDGPTPKSVKANPSQGLRNGQVTPEPRPEKGSTPAEDEQRAVERERLDTFWSIFFLDRVISSGTGRPVTLRDKDITISFPSLDEVDLASGWPLPFPALIRIVHLYGRVTDLLNSIKEKAPITEDLRRQLDALEYSLTEIYQGLSPKLHFNALNFQHYVKIDQGTNFLLLHCWFHTLIVFLHQPTLLKPFEGSVQHLSSNSRELSMSSAKTVADILAFTELIDAKTGVGNPFTSQPIYIVACAFLKETALHSATSQPHSRRPTPDLGGNNGFLKSDKQLQSLDHLDFDNPPRPINVRTSHKIDHEQKKHTLLASAANQNYQRCYRALKSLEVYWAGIKYILTVLDQKAKGVGDPLLYTREEMESALEVPMPEPSFTIPGWRRKLSEGTYLTAENMDESSAAKMPGSPMSLPNQAIGWSLTGTMNSPSTNVAVMYTSDTNSMRDSRAAAESVQPANGSFVYSNPPRATTSRFKLGNSTTDLSGLPASASAYPFPAHSHQVFDPAIMPPPLHSTNQYHPTPTHDSVLVSDADLLLNLHSPFSGNSPTAMSTSFARGPTSLSHAHHNGLMSPPDFSHYPTPTENFGDINIDSQDIDMSALGPDMMPWDLEFLPHDFMFFNDDGYGVIEEKDAEAEEGAG